MDQPLTPTNGHSTEPPAEPSSSFDSAIFRSYLQALLPPVLGASLPELESLFDDEFHDRVVRFASEGGGVVYVVKAKDEAEGESRIIWRVLILNFIQMRRRHRRTATSSLPIWPTVLHM